MGMWQSLLSTAISPIGIKWPWRFLTNTLQTSSSSRERIARASTLDECLCAIVDTGFDFEKASRTSIRKITNGFSAGDEVTKAFRRHEEAIRLHWCMLLERQGVAKDVRQVSAHALLGIVNNIVFNCNGSTSHKRARDTAKKLTLGAIHVVVPSPAGEKPFDPIYNFNSVNLDDTA